MTIVVQATFQGSWRYTLVPHHWTYLSALGTMLAWPYLSDLAGCATERRGYGNTDSGIGLEYPTRLERAGQVRVWYWDWGTRPLKTRKYHIPEADYLAVLVALLRAHDRPEEADSVAALHPSLPEITVLREPDRFYIGNWTLTPFSWDAYHCLRLILETRDLEKVATSAATQSPLFLPDNTGISFLEDDTVLLTLTRGRTCQVPTPLFTELLAQLQR